VLLNLAFVAFGAGVAQIYSIMSVIFVYTGIVLLYRPYRHPIANFHEIITCLSIAYGGAMLTWFADRENDEHDKAIGWTACFVTLIPIVSGFAAVLYLYYVHGRSRNPHTLSWEKEKDFLRKAAYTFAELNEDDGCAFFWDQIGEYGRWHFREMATLIHSELLSSGNAMRQIKRLTSRSSRSNFKLIPSRSSKQEPTVFKVEEDHSHVMLVEEKSKQVDLLTDAQLAIAELPYEITPRASGWMCAITPQDELAPSTPHRMCVNTPQPTPLSTPRHITQ
jgi:hypothetical protein